MPVPAPLNAHEGSLGPALLNKDTEITDTHSDAETSRFQRPELSTPCSFSINILNGHPYFTLIQVRASECLNITQSFLFTARHLCARNWHLKVSIQLAAKTRPKLKVGASRQHPRGHPTPASAHHLCRGHLQHLAETHNWVPFAWTSRLSLHKYTGFLHV